MPVAAFTSATAIVAAISAFSARETCATPMAQLGRAGEPASAGGAAAHLDLGPTT
jgi:hypothetical protein